MKEVTFLLPEDSAKLVTELVERLGGAIEKKNEVKSRSVKKKKIAVSKRTNANPSLLLKKNTDSDTEKTNNKSEKKVSKSNKKAKKEKIDHTYLFGKWKDFDIDAEKLREELWKRY